MKFVVKSCQVTGNELLAGDLVRVRVAAVQPDAVEFLKKERGDIFILEDNYVFVVILVGARSEIQLACDDDFVVYDDYFMAETLATECHRRNLEQPKAYSAARRPQPASICQSHCVQRRASIPAGKLPVQGKFQVTCMLIGSAAVCNVRCIPRYLEGAMKAEKPQNTAHWQSENAPEQSGV